MSLLVEKIREYLNGELREETILDILKEDDIPYRLEIKSVLDKRGTTLRQISIESDNFDMQQVKELADLGFAPSRMVRVEKDEGGE